jgi:hypothetical protein
VGTARRGAFENLTAIHLAKVVCLFLYLFTYLLTVYLVRIAFTGMWLTALEFEMNVKQVIVSSFDVLSWQLLGETG